MLRKKYLTGINQRCLDQKPITKGFRIWALCKAAWNFFSEGLYWVPGNGRKINMFADKIMNNEALQNNQELHDIAAWLRHHGITTLKEFSTWDSHGDWKSWKSIIIPPRGCQQYTHWYLKRLRSPKPHGKRRTRMGPHRCIHLDSRLQSTSIPWWC